MERKKREESRKGTSTNPETQAEEEKKGCERKGGTDSGPAQETAERRYGAYTVVWEFAGNRTLAECLMRLMQRKREW